MNIRLSGLTTTALFCLLTSHVFATTYTGTKPKDLDITTPTESNTKISEFNNSDREIKTVITNLEGITAVTGTYTVGGTQTTIIGSSTAGFTISFPAASTLATAAIKKKYEIKNINTGTITLNLTVDGVGSPTVSGSQTIHIYTDGTSWYESGARTAQTSGNADYLDNLDSTYYTNATNLATGTVALARIPSTLTGKDADTVDGYHAGTSASRVLVLDASALVPLANIPSTLTGKDADSIDSIDGTNIVQTSRTISTTSPLAGGGALSGNLTLSMPLATSGQNGYISSSDWNTFNNKVSTTVTISTTAPLTGGGDLSSNRTFAMSAATASQDGYFKKEDFQTFSNKANIVAGSGITSSSTTGTTTITNNGVLQIIAGAGISASNNGTGSVTLTAVGTTTAGGWLDTGTASVGSSGYPIIPRGTITVDTAYGITGILDRDIPQTITLDNLTQITTRNYDDLSGTSTVKPTQIAVGTSTLQGAVNVSGTVTASGFSGNGAGLTNLPSSPVSFADITGVPTGNAYVSATPGTNKIPYSTDGTLNNWIVNTVIKLHGTTTQQVAGAYGQLYVHESSAGNSNFGTLTTNSLVSYYRLDDLTDDFDSNNLTNYGSTTFVAGKYGNCATFNGTTQYLQKSSVLSTATTNISMFGWVYIPDTSRKGAFFHNGTGTSPQTGYSLGVGNAQYDIVGNNLVGAANGVAWLDFATPIGTGWHHIGITRDATTWRGYIDKVQCVNTFTNNPNIPTSTFSIGATLENGWQYFSDKIDDVVFYNKCLSAGEIVELYNNTRGAFYTQYSAKYSDPVNGSTVFEISTPGTATTEASYIYNNATTTVWGLGTNTAVTGTASGAYAGWTNRPIRVLAIDIGSSKEIKENIKTIKIKPDHLDAEGLAKQNYIAGAKAAWIAAHQAEYEITVNETGTGSVIVVDTATMESDYNNYIELEWASDMNQDVYTETVQKQHEKGFWQMYNSVTPRSWNPKDNPSAEYEGFVVGEMPPVVWGDDKQSVNLMSVVAYIAVVQQALKADTIFALTTLKELITTGTVTQQKIDYCNDRLEVLNP